jgi:hypothetical protein
MSAIEVPLIVHVFVAFAWGGGDADRELTEEFAAAVCKTARHKRHEASPSLTSRLIETVSFLMVLDAFISCLLWLIDTAHRSVSIGPVHTNSDPRGE